MKQEIENIKEQIVTNWLKSQTEYVGDCNGKYNLDSVCLDGWFNLEELSSLIADEVLKVVVETNSKLIELLKVAKCPEYDCDNNGTIACRISDDEWEPQQCQWCYEKKDLLSNLSPNKENKNNG